MLALVGTPGAEYEAGQFQASFAEGLLLGESLGVAAEVALEMRPADLSAVGVEVLVARPAVRDHDPGERADQLVELIAVAALGDLEDRRSWCVHRPQRPRVSGGPPAGLVDMQRVLGVDPVPQLLIRARERVCGVLADRVHTSDR